MRTTLVLDDALWDMAKEYTGLSDTATIVREAVKALIERERARRLARMGGIPLRLTLGPLRRIGRA